MRNVGVLRALLCAIHVLAQPPPSSRPPSRGPRPTGPPPYPYRTDIKLILVDPPPYFPGQPITVKWSGLSPMETSLGFDIHAQCSAKPPELLLQVRQANATHTQVHIPHSGRCKLLASEVQRERRLRGTSVEFDVTTAQQPMKSQPERPEGRGRIRFVFRDLPPYVANHPVLVQWERLGINKEPQSFGIHLECATTGSTFLQQVRPEDGFEKSISVGHSGRGCQFVALTDGLDGGVEGRSAEFDVLESKPDIQAMRPPRPDPTPTSTIAAPIQTPSPGYSPGTRSPLVPALSVAVVVLFVLTAILLFIWRRRKARRLLPGGAISESHSSISEASSNHVDTSATAWRSDKVDRPPMLRPLPAPPEDAESGGQEVPPAYTRC